MAPRIFCPNYVFSSITYRTLYDNTRIMATDKPYYLPGVSQLIH